MLGFILGLVVGTVATVFLYPKVEQFLARHGLI